MKVEISNNCNHNCIFCGRNKINKTGGFINDDFFLRIMKEAFDEGVREVGLFINGEPFTDPKLAKRIETSKKIGYEYVYITTNGSLAVPDRLQSVIDAGLDSIKFSINAANREDYLKIHGKDDFDRVIDNLKDTRSYRDTKKLKYNIFGSFVVTNLTKSTIEYFKQHYVPLFDDFAFYNVRNNGIMDENENIAPFGFTAQNRCTLPFNTINIDYDGSLLACCEDINHRIPVANLSKMTLREAWYCDNMKILRQKHIEGKLSGTVCEKCLMGGGGVVEVLDV